MATTQENGTRFDVTTLVTAAVVGRGVLQRHLELELTQEQLAERAGVSVPTVANAERGLPIRRLNAQKLARALGRTREELFPEPQEASA